MTRIDPGRVDRTDPVPLYHQLKLALRESIERNRFQPGDKLPSEAEIEKIYGVSRTTIRQALGELESEGIIERIQGKGSFLKARPVQHVASLTSFAEDMRSHGRVPSRKLIRIEFMGASQEAALHLGCDESEPCVYIVRLLFADAARIGLAETWIPVKVLKGGEDALRQLHGRSLYEVLRQPPIALALTSGSEVVAARPADETAAELLDCAVGEPLLSVERVARADHGTAVEWTKTEFPWRRYEYRVEITAPSNQP